ncbi:MAG: MYXO-CTERM sorting domain-containing protein [Pseudomonadota bacterium]|nr:MYXO-CTERM sorting domain-containing protein [Pseudomonadota bacterium]
MDDDCDGTVDEADAVDVLTWYADADADGWGFAGTTAAACAQPDGYTDDPDDCDGNDDDQDGDGVALADDCDDTDAARTDDCDTGGGETGVVEETGDPEGEDTGSGEDKVHGGCGCASPASAPGSAGFLLGAVALAAVGRRRR